MNDASRRWPDVEVATWSTGKRTLHRVLQMLGKVRVALSPTQPNWMFTPLYPTARGFTTGFIPLLEGSLELRLDVFDSEIRLERSTGERRSVSLAADRSIAEIFAEVQEALRAISAPCTIDATPQELPDATPFHADRAPGAYDAQAVQRWFASVMSAAGIFDRWRSHFFGRSGVQLWWGALDLAVILFNGKKVAAPRDRGYLMRYDLDAELMNVGLYYGDEATAPFFYGYIYPEPPNAANLAIGPTGVSWSADLHEWILPYDTVKHSADPEQALRAFLDAIYAQCGEAAGWDLPALTYEPPPRRSSS